MKLFGNVSSGIVCFVSFLKWAHHSAMLPASLVHWYKNVTPNQWHGVLKIITVLIWVGFKLLMARSVRSIRNDVHECRVSKKLHTVNEQEDEGRGGRVALCSFTDAAASCLVILFYFFPSPPCWPFLDWGTGSNDHPSSFSFSLLANDSRESEPVDDSLPVYDSLKFCASKNTDRIYIYNKVTHTHAHIYTWVASFCHSPSLDWESNPDQINESGSVYHTSLSTDQSCKMKRLLKLKLRAIVYVLLNGWKYEHEVPRLTQIEKY